MEEEKLKILGLNSYEIKALMTLYKKGKSKASFISADSGVPYGKIYDTLDSLEHKGLIHIIPENVKYYVAKPISYLKKLLKEKTHQLEKLDKDLDELETITEHREEGEIIVVRGKRNFHKLIKELPSSKEFNYSIKWIADVTDLNIMKRVKNSIKNNPNKIRKTLYGYNVSKENIKKWEKYVPYYKFINTNGVAMGIDEIGVTISILNLNSTIYIKSSSFSEVLKQLFDGYYENQK